MSADKQRLEEVIACAISVIYSEEYEFVDAVVEIVLQENVSAIQAYVALSAATSTKDGGSYDIEDCLATIRKVHEELDSDTSLLLCDLCENKAKGDFLTVQMANMLLRIACEAERPSFGGEVYKAEKLKNGPLTSEERHGLLIKYPLK